MGKGKTESIKVVVRARPLNKREKALKCQYVLDIDRKMSQIGILNPANKHTKRFTFDAVYPHTVTQQEVYEESAFSLVEDVANGYNGTLFAYGQTGCGKTYSMMGFPDDPELAGITPRCFQHVFKIIENSDSNDKKFLVRCSYIEIYNEQVLDLLAKDNHKPLNVRQSKDKGIFIQDLKFVVSKGTEGLIKAMDKGNGRRSVGATAMNATSSRSHSIFTLYVETSEIIGGKETFKQGKLNLVDLAGSERQSKTEAEGQRLKEAMQINLSLTALGNVISALVEGGKGKKKKHVPYRDSKLTRLLQDSLGGNTKTIMIANCSPASDNYDETLGTLRYADRAKQIKNKPKINEDPKDALLRQYSDEIKKLKKMLETQQKEGGNNMPPEKLETLSLDKKQSFMQKMKMGKGWSSLITDMESRINQGGNVQGGDKVQTEEEKKKFDDLRLKLKQQAEEQELIKEQHKQKQFELVSVNKNFKSLKDEVQDMRNIMMKIREKYGQAMQEIEDLSYEHYRDKQDHLDTIRVLEKELQLHQAICKVMLSKKEFKQLRKAAVWRDDLNCFKIPAFKIKEDLKDHRENLLPQVQEGQEFMPIRDSCRVFDFETLPDIEDQQGAHDIKYATTKGGDNREEMQYQPTQQVSEGPGSQCCIVF